MNPLPKSDDLYWTQHSRHKLRQYNLSESRIKRVLRFPDRKEVGVAPNTTAVMQKTGSKKHPYEIWAMFQEVKSLKSKVKSLKKITIISTWRYPGISPIHEPPPIPEEVWEVLARRKNLV
ncbi:MAG: hypothetical protein HY764_00990 [Candidatus Portnoybacteria bacterium]|nr:hypothetical protein [Candidatus Portnoybacteria bacterium]